MQRWEKTNVALEIQQRDGQGIDGMLEKIEANGHLCAWLNCGKSTQYPKFNAMERRREETAFVCGMWKETSMGLPHLQEYGHLHWVHAL